ncbi:MAG: methyltransferase [Bryobacterales bacterium]|nr:methyltransferase [Bryobacterales bacterium]
MDDFGLFRDVLDRGGYSASNIAMILGPNEFLPGDPVNTRFFHYRAGLGGTTGTLIRIFLTHTGTGVEEARQALAPIPLEDWAAAGFLELSGDTVRGRIRLHTASDVILAVDPAEAASRPDQVMGLTQASLLAANFTLRRPVNRFLDLGTGNGIQALLASPQARQVFATDVSPRAVEFARFNARLNRRTNVRCLAGGLFEPVRGQLFDQIVSNPPFFISPDSRLLYRDSGMRLDGMVRQIIGEAPGYLNEGGYCQLLANWVHLKGEDWKQRILSWQEGTGCDLWVLRTEVLDPATYARNWINETTGGAENPFDEWLRFYEQENIEAIGSGMIAMRKKTGGANWHRIEEFTPVSPAPFGEAVEQGFRLTDYVNGTSDAELSRAVLQGAPGLTLNQHARFDAGRWLTEAAEIRLTSGIPFRAQLDQNSLRLLTGCDGRKTFGEVLSGFPQNAWPSCFQVARSLVWRGFLLPA